MREITPEAAGQLYGLARIRIIRESGRRPVLEEQLPQIEVSNLELLLPVQRCELMAHYREADALFLHLHDHAAFRKILPSKVFEYAAPGKPVVAGFLAEFVEREISGGGGIFAMFRRWSDGWVGAAREGRGPQGLPASVERGEFKAKHAREEIMREMAV